MVQTVKIRKSKVELIDKNIRLVDFRPLEGVQEPLLYILCAFWRNLGRQTLIGLIHPFSHMDFQNFYIFGISNDRAFISIGPEVYGDPKKNSL